LPRLERAQDFVEVLAEARREASVDGKPEGIRGWAIDAPQRGADVSDRGDGDIAHVEGARVDVDRDELPQRIAHSRAREANDGKAVALIHDGRKVADRFAKRGRERVAAVLARCEPRAGPCPQERDVVGAHEARTGGKVESESL